MGQPATRRRENIALLSPPLPRCRRAAVLALRAANRACSSLLCAGSRWRRWSSMAASGARLTAWIFIAMLLGAEIGHDFPNVATNLRVLALIFLRLIKTIIAPLLFATLVVGIAGHSNLRQVGRLGLAIHHLLRDRHHHRHLPRTRRHQPDQGWCGRATARNPHYRNHLVVVPAPTKANSSLRS